MIQRVNAWLEKQLTTDQMTYRELRSMFLTLILDQFFIFFIGVLSTSLVSSIGEEAIAAVSMVGTVNAMVSLVFTSLASGGALVVARAKGRNDFADIRRVIGEVTGLCCVVATVLSVLLYTLAGTTVGYMRLMAISFIPFSIFNAIFAIFRNLGDTRSALILTIMINVSHLLLSLLFINGLGLGVRGSGLSYIVARALGMVIALVWILKVSNNYGVTVRDFFHFRKTTTREILSLGMPMTVESLLMQGGMLLVQIYLARLTTTDLAAHSVANSILSLYYTTSGALVTMSGTVCGQCYGAKRNDLMVHYCHALIRVGRILMGLTVVILYPMTPLLLKLYHATPQGTEIIYQALRIGAFTMPFLYGDSYIPAMALRVAGDSVFAGFVSVSGLVLGRCVLGYVLTIPLGLGVPGVWIGQSAEWLYRAVTLRLRMRGKEVDSFRKDNISGIHLSFLNGLCREGRHTIKNWRNEDEHHDQRIPGSAASLGKDAAGGSVPACGKDRMGRVHHHGLSDAGGGGGQRGIQTDAGGNRMGAYLGISVAAGSSDCADGSGWEDRGIRSRPE